jgi:Cys-tRNA(Pro)/Cys-tRNA(Cys) deacylase
MWSKSERLMARNTRSPTKTNAARALDRLDLRYELHPYDIGADEHLSASEVARKVGRTPEQVFKTLVARGDRTGPIFCVVPANAELDLKAAARASENRSVVLVPLKEVTALTGYLRGGTTALAPKKPFPVFVDESARDLESFVVSAGQRGLQLELAPMDYLLATEGTWAPLARPE